MSIQSNLYAEKIFSDHPIGLWSLDDDVNYLSLISNSQRNLSTWQFLDSQVAVSTEKINQPFFSNFLNEIEFDDFLSSSKEIKFVGPNLDNLEDLNQYAATLTSGCYFYTESAYIKSVSIGFEYNDTSSGETIEKIKKYETNISQKWIFLSHTSTFPNQSTSFRPLIKVEFEGGAASTESYKIFTNGFTIGQESENFNTISLGVDVQTFPNTIAISGVDQACVANSYIPGLSNGYYLIKNNRLLAKNTSVPMVYGSDSITKIIPNENNPSFIIPGFGFLNEIGKYKQYTVEMWLRVDCNSLNNFRIFGPIGSTDGIYIKDGFISLVVGEYFGSHYVGEWYRPMLLQIKTTQTSASLSINGEQVINLNLHLENVNFPLEFDNSDKELNWLGFYSNEDIAAYEIDCLAIYSYLVPDVVSKIRWVTGQGVFSPEVVNSSYGASSVYIDYPYSEYTANYTYPNIGTWDQATNDNMKTTEKNLSIVKHDLPVLFLEDKTEGNFFTDNQAVQDEDLCYFTFRPNSTWNNKKTYAYFDNFTLNAEKVGGIFTVFKIDESVNQNQTLFTIYDINSSDYFKVTLNGRTLSYNFSYNQEVTTLTSISSIPLDTYFPAGFTLSVISEYFGLNLSSFFDKTNSLKINLGANQNGLENFLGKFYKFDICSRYNVSLISDSFLSNGLCDSSKVANLLSHTSTYTLKAVLNYDNYYFDIDSYGYWEDYLPLSYFASYVNNSNGDRVYDLDFIQFNIDYPTPTSLLFSETVSSWDYENLDLSYDHTVQRSYSQLDNSLFSGWQDYEDMDQQSIKNYFYDTENSFVRSYITFQSIDSGANKNLKNFSQKQTVRNNKILNVSNFNDWENIAFEVVDNTIIYPPSGVDFNKFAIVTHLVFDIKGTRNYDLTLKKIEFASQALDNSSSKQIGTRFGNLIYPYRKTGIYFDYKSKNPISIYKESVPYLYSTKKSGIEIRGNFNPFVSRGVRVPINQNNSSNYKMSALQMWVRYNLDKFSYGATQVFEIEHKGDIIEFFISATDGNGKRGKIFAVNKSNKQEVNGLAFYINGNIVREPIIDVREWAVLGVSFANSLDFSNFSGSINLNGPFVYNNVTNYQSTSLQEIQSKVFRPWLKVKSSDGIDLFWSYWLQSYNWDGVLVLSTSELYGIDPSVVYKAYIGRNKTTINENTDVSLNFTLDSVKIYSDTSWQLEVKSPV